MSRTRKSINFDLDTKLLQKFYPKDNWRYAYKEIQSFLEDKDFEHRQGSGYVSSKPVLMSEMQDLVEQLVTKFDWLTLCVKEFDVTSVGKQFSFIDVMESTYDRIFIENDLEEELTEEMEL